MRRGRLTLIAAIGMAVLILSSVVNATAASNTVAESAMEDSEQDISVDQRKPEECDGITLSGGFVGGGNITGTNANELLLGGPNNQTIDGSGGNDCILGGGGADTLRGAGGTDVILGGPGNDSLAGGPGNDTFNNDCETRIQ